MNHAVAVDASVAVKWVVAEQDTDRAQALLNDSLTASRPIVTPPHFTGEVVNAIYRRMRRTGPHQLSRTQAETAVHEFLRYPTRALTFPDLYEQAFTFADAHSLSAIYDSLYVVFARLLGVDLWSADEHLLNAVASIAPWVRPISAYPVDRRT